MNKIDLLSQLENVKNNWILGLAAAGMLHRSDAPQLLESGGADFDGLSINFDQVGTLLRNPTNKQLALTEFCKAHFRTLSIETFERIKVYADATGQRHRFKAHENYWFFHHVRNALVHDYCFDLTKHEKNLPVEWRGKRIELSMHGIPMALDFLGFDGFYEMYHELRQFAEEKLD